MFNYPMMYSPLSHPRCMILLFLDEYNLSYILKILALLNLGSEWEATI